MSRAAQSVISRRRVDARTRALVLDGTAGTNVSTPAIPAIGGATELELEWFGTLAAWPSASVQTLVSQYRFQTNDRVFSLHALTSGAIQLTVSGTGSDFFNTNRLHTVGDGEPGGFLAKWRSSDGRMQLFQADDPTDPDNTTWTQLGSDVTGLTDPLHTASDPIEIGTRALGHPAEGNFTRVVIRTAPPVASPDFTAQAPGSTSFTDAQGNVWTLNGNAKILSVPR